MKKNKFFIPRRYLPLFKNKFTLTLLGFLIWLSFFDRNDFITTWSYHNKLESLISEKLYFEEEIKKNTEDLNNLLTNYKTMEKFAREHYLMKKDNEDIYVIVEEKREEE